MRRNVKIGNMKLLVHRKPTQPSYLAAQASWIVLRFAIFHDRDIIVLTPSASLWLAIVYKKP